MSYLVLVIIGRGGRVIEIAQSESQSPARAAPPARDRAHSCSCDFPLPGLDVTVPAAAAAAAAAVANGPWPPHGSGRQAMAGGRWLKGVGPPHKWLLAPTGSGLLYLRNGTTASTVTPIILDEGPSRCVREVDHVMVNTGERGPYLAAAWRHGSTAARRHDLQHATHGAQHEAHHGGPGHRPHTPTPRPHHAHTVHAHPQHVRSYTQASGTRPLHTIAGFGYALDWFAAIGGLSAAETYNTGLYAASYALMQPTEDEFQGFKSGLGFQNHLVKNIQHHNNKSHAPFASPSPPHHPTAPPRHHFSPQRGPRLGSLWCFAGRADARRHGQQRGAVNAAV